MKVVDGTFKVSHEAVHIANSRVGGGMLRNEDQGLPMVLQCLLMSEKGLPYFEGPYCSVWDHKKMDNYDYNMLILANC